MKTFLFFLLTSISLSFQDPYLIKRISDSNYRYEFYTTDQKIKPKNNKTYYWFKGGLVHQAQGGVAGELLHGKYLKMFHSNQLAEQGYFKKGLKNGVWKTWYSNGQLETLQKWSNGLKKGKFIHYDEKGIILEKGKFSRNGKRGKWIDFVKKDTTIYKKGVVYHKKVKPSREAKIKLREERKKLKFEKKNSKKASKSKEVKIEKSKNNSGGFLKRLFSKNEPKIKSNG